MSYNWYHNFAQLARDSGFCLRESESDSFIDWRFIASIDTNRIVNQNDFEKLDECLPHILKSGIGSILNIRILDPAIGKYFVISQLVAQFLLFCKQFLDKTVVELRETIFEGQKDALRMEKLLQKRDDEIHNLQRKLNKNELMQSKFPCKSCTKNFISEELLNFHVSRKHPEKENAAKAADMDSTLINTIKLELEIKQLKERLLGAEKQLIDQKISCEKCQKDYQNPQEVQKSSICIQTNLEEVKEKDELEIGLRTEDFIEKSELQKILNAQQEQYANWKKKDEKKYQELNTRLDDLLKKKEQLQITEPVIKSKIPIITKVQGSPEVDKIDKLENEKWKLRYDQLEDKYLDGQKQLKTTIENMEKVYIEKLKTIENSVNTMKVPKPEKPKIKLVTRLNPTPLTEIEKKESTLVASRKLLNQSKTFMNSSLSSVSTNESESEEESDEQSRSLTKLAVVTVHQDDVTQKASVRPIKRDSLISAKLQKILKREVITLPAELNPPIAAPRENFSAQKDDVRGKDKNKTKSLPIETVDFKNAAISVFQERMKTMGLDERNGVHPKDFPVINEEIVKKREGSKKLFKSFFITRKKISTEIDKMVQEKLKMPMETTVYSSEEDRSRKNIIALKKSRNTLKGQKFMTNKNDEELKQNLQITKSFNRYMKDLSIPELAEPLKVKVTQPESDSSKINFEEFQGPIHLGRNIASKETPKFFEVTPKIGDEPAERSNLYNLSRVTSNTSNKKRVGFNLDTIPDEDEIKSSPAKFVIPTVKDSKELKKELSDSDWNISSFDDEEVVDGKFVKR